MTVKRKRASQVLRIQNPEDRIVVSLDYFGWVGGFVGAFAGAGCDLVGCDLMPCSTDDGPLRLAEYTDKVIEVIMNATADQVVALERALAAPRGPNAVWLP